MTPILTRIEMATQEERTLHQGMTQTTSPKRMKKGGFSVVALRANKRKY